MQKVFDLLGDYIDVGRRYRLAPVVDVSRWSATGVSYVSVELDGGVREAIYRDGRVPVVGEYVHVTRMAANLTSPYIALPLPSPLAERHPAFPLLMPAFDNRRHRGGTGFDASDPEFAVVLGRREDGSWVKRSNYPISNGDYSSLYGGDRDEMRARIAVVSHSTLGLIHITWVTPDGGVGAGANVYYSTDDGATWSALGFYDGLTDVDGTKYLWDGGTKLSYDIGGGFADVDDTPPITADLDDAYTHAGALSGFQYPPFIEQNNPEWFWLFVVNADGLTVVRQDVFPLSTSYTTMFTYSPPTTTDYPKYGRVVLWNPSGVISVGSRIYWLTGVDHDGNNASVVWAGAIDVIQGTPTWTTVADGDLAMTVKHAAAFQPLGGQATTFVGVGVDASVVGTRAVAGFAQPWYLGVGPDDLDHPAKPAGYRTGQQPLDFDEVTNRNTGLIVMGPSPQQGSRYDGHVDLPRLVEVVLNTGTQSINTLGVVRTSEGDLRAAFDAEYVGYGDTAPALATGGSAWWQVS